MSPLTEVTPVPETFVDTFAEKLATETLQADSHALVQGRSKRFNWLFFTWLAVFHIGAIAALFFFSWSALAVALILWVFAQNVGIGMSYHRQLTHRGYTTPRWVEYQMAVCATLALQGGPIFWVADIALHHQPPTGKAIRTPPGTANGGRTWAGCLQGTLRNRNTPADSLCS